MYDKLDKIVISLSFVVLMVTIILPSPWTYIVGVPFLIFYTIYEFYVRIKLGVKR